MKISVTIRVSGDRVVPEEITTILCVNPHVARLKGDVRISSTGEKNSSKFGLWAWKSEDISGTLTINDHINQIKTVFEHTYSSFSSLPHAENTWVDICFVKDELDGGDALVEFLLEKKSLKILLDLGIPVEFTVY